MEKIFRQTVLAEISDRVDYFVEKVEQEYGVGREKAREAVYDAFSKISSDVGRGA